MPIPPNIEVNIVGMNKEVIKTIKYDFVKGEFICLSKLD